MSEAAHTALQEKSSAALSSVLAAIGLTAFKIIVGLATNSLGILAEAAHSGLDLLAALVTFFGVRIAGKPADDNHHYGHGKVENLSALFETLLLLATCGWIIYESVQRLWFHPETVEVSAWAFIVMATSIGVDYNRSRMLYRAARKHNSQALEADALHFSTDIWSSSVVILGLGLVWLSERIPALSMLAKADAVAALVVALIVIYVSFELGVRTLHGLMDQAPQKLRAQVIHAAQNVPGVLDAHQVRIRPSGAELFIDLHVLADSSLDLEAAHNLTLQIEQAVAQVAPRADITVHVEPAEEAAEITETTIKEADDTRSAPDSASQPN